MDDAQNAHECELSELWTRPARFIVTTTHFVAATTPEHSPFSRYMVKRTGP
ncbi:hypothetical protein [Sphingomonas hankookensis]|jgi:hypothetical protein|uniref:hypothetical protein n=1 Tax=Sphingomonas hankookensis TaxID=563996 RepID=UPI0012ED8278|nr:hypothetical protein [Sphingomonas hankookensis]